MTSSFKTITNLPGWASGELAQYEITSTTQAYQQVPLVKRCVDLIADSVCQIPVTINGQSPEQAWHFDTELQGLLGGITRELLLHGSALVLKIRNGLGQVVGLQLLSAPTMTVQLDHVHNGRAIRKFQQYINGQRYPQKQEWWTESDILFLRLFNPVDQVGHGTAPAEVALIPSQLLHYLNVFQSKYFGEGALNVWIIGLSEGYNESDKNRMRDFFKRSLTGLRRAFGVQVVSGQIHAQQLSSPISELQLETQKQMAKEDVLHAFGIPEDLLENASWAGTVEQHHKQFWQSTIRPLAEIIAAGFRQSLAVDMVFSLEEMSLFQRDESQRAGSLLQLVQAGVPLAVAWHTLGYATPLEVPLLHPTASGQL